MLNVIVFTAKIKQGSLAPSNIPEQYEDDIWRRYEANDPPADLKEVSLQFYQWVLKDGSMTLEEGKKIEGIENCWKVFNETIDDTEKAVDLDDQLKTTTGMAICVFAKPWLFYSFYKRGKMQNSLKHDIRADYNVFDLEQAVGDGPIKDGIVDWVRISREAAGNKKAVERYLNLLSL